MLHFTLLSAPSNNFIKAINITVFDTFVSHI